MNGLIDLNYMTVAIEDGRVIIEPKKSMRIKHEFREDMNVKKAIKDLIDDYIDEAMERVGSGHGSTSRCAKLLGFPSYQSFAYWIKRRKKDGEKVDDEVTLPKPPWEKNE
jgi:hypothetical protein